MPITPKKYLDYSGTESVIQEARRRIEEAGGGGSSLDGATVNITSGTSDFYGKDCVITSDVSVVPTTIKLSDSGTATVVINAVGTYNFSVTVGGKTYTTRLVINSNMTYSVQLNYYKIVPWSTGTDQEIVALINALDNGDVTTSEIGWEVGDERVVSLNALAAGDFNVAHDAQDVTFVIMNKSNYNGVGHYIIGMKDCLAEKEKMEATGGTNQNGWHNSRGRKCCDAIFNMIPNTLQPIFKTFSVTSATKGGSNTPGVTAQSGKLALFAEKEIFGSKTYSCQDEFNSSAVPGQMSWFATAANRIKKVNSSANSWWERSPYYDTTDRFCLVNNSGNANRNYVDNSYGFSPFGVI